jgi:hypothetical protein
LCFATPIKSTPAATGRGHSPFYCFVAPINPAEGERKEKKRRIKEKKRVCARGRRPFYCFATPIKPAEGE